MAVENVPVKDGCDLRCKRAQMGTAPPFTLIIVTVEIVFTISSSGNAVPLMEMISGGDTSFRLLR